jgi:hypothetical protein
MRWSHWGDFIMLKHRIPTIIGLVLLIIGAFGGVLFMSQTTDFLPRASPAYIPQKINLTNVTDSGFVVSWLTQEPTIGFIQYGLDRNHLDTTVTDERDQLTGNSDLYRTHYVPILGLSPQTTYYFKLGSEGKKLYDDHGQELSVTTGPTLASAPPSDTAYGVVLTPASTSAEGALIYLSFPSELNLAPLSALVKQNGNWAINLSTVRSHNLSTYASYTPETQLQILVHSTLFDDASALTTVNLTQPVPPITLGQTHDFTSQLPPPQAQPLFTTAPTPISNPTTHVLGSTTISPLTLYQSPSPSPSMIILVIFGMVCVIIGLYFCWRFILA